MNLSAKMICPNCGKDMYNNGCQIGGTITTYTRKCDCGMAILCVPMKDKYSYSVRLHNEELDEKRRLAERKVRECEEALDKAKRDLQYI